MFSDRHSEKNSKQARRAKSRSQRSRRHRVETLEDRRVLSINPINHLVNLTTLVIRGGGEDDTVVVSESRTGLIQVEQTTLGEVNVSSYSKLLVTSLQFFGEEGDDSFTNLTDIPVYAEGGPGNDTLIGGDAADILVGGDGNDRLEGHGSHDNLRGGNGADTISGGDGADTIDGGDGNDQLSGDAGNDTLFGRTGDDRIEGGDGNDYLEGNEGNDTINGGSGRDRLVGADGNDTMRGQEGDDVLLGQGGSDVLFGDSGDDRIEGGDGKDLLYGGDGEDLVYGGAGNDRLEGGNGGDYLEGNEGNDIVNGGDGNDRLLGGEGDDVLSGQEGHDTLLGQAGEDLLFGDAGNDNLDGGDNKDLLYGGDGEDQLYGGGGRDRLEGGNQDDYLEGGDDSDVVYGGEGNDRLLGGDGYDVLRGNNGDDTLLGQADNDLLFGGAGNDRLEGSAGNDLLYGGDGEDLLFGEAGRDRLEGGNDADYLEGGEGDDVVYGGQGRDHLLGGDGNDVLYGQGEDDFLSGQDGDDLLIGGDGNDQLDGGSSNDLLYGNAGDDILRGQVGDDYLSGDDGEDYLAGDDGNDRLFGGAGDDNLNGNSGDDELSGQAGEDKLYGGVGQDILLGGDGNDLLYGEQDADALVGGAGSDEMISGDGNDLLIGGDDVDKLFGEAGDDLLIGAKTSYDSNVLALREAIVAWSSNLDYEDRVDQLSDPSSKVYFVPHETVHADLVADMLYGGGDLDWFVLSANNGVYNRLGVESDQGDSSGFYGSELLLDEPPVLEGFALIDSIDFLGDANDSETVHTLTPHGDDASKLSEHLSLFQLVRYADVTHTAVASGSWFDPSIWQGGRVPGDGARVLIPLGADVVIDGMSEVDLETVRVDGVLRFGAEGDSHLRVDTMVVTTTGTLEMGTEEDPIDRDVTATLTFTDSGPIDRNADPFGISRGLITHGAVRMHGTEVTSFTTASGTLSAGKSAIQLASLPVGWKVGDRIVIAGAAVGGGQDEVREILSIYGNRIRIAPLEFDHIAPEEGLEIHVSNLTRNVVIETEANIDSRRGHVMFMHNRNVHVDYVAFNGLGRTDKSVALNDSVVDESWNLVEGTGANQRARYSVHFHRNGVQANSAPATVNGSVVNGGPGWGYVNHSSYVDFTNNVSYAINGAAYVSEAGDEIGAFDANIAMGTTGSDADPDSRVGHQDFGFNGDGFWLQGPGVSVTNNIATGSSGSAFVYYSRGLQFAGHTTLYLAENLDDPSLAGGEAALPVDYAVIKEFSNNIGYGSEAGLSVFYNLRKAPHSGQSVLRDSTFWNNRTGVDLLYTESIVLSDIAVIADPDANAHTGIDNNAVTQDITYRDVRVEGYDWGINIPVRGTSTVIGGRFINKAWNIVIAPANYTGVKVLITGDPEFGGIDGRRVEDVAMYFQTQNAAENPNTVFKDIEVLLQYGEYDNHRLYFRQQAADAVPFSRAEPRLSTDYVGLTQAELLERFDIAIGGEIAPTTAFETPDLLGLVARA